MAAKSTWPKGMADRLFGSLHQVIVTKGVAAWPSTSADLAYEEDCAWRSPAESGYRGLDTAVLRYASFTAFWAVVNMILPSVWLVGRFGRHGWNFRLNKPCGEWTPLVRIGHTWTLQKGSKDRLDRRDA
jgi:hypothetical protein